MAAHYRDVLRSAIIAGEWAPGARLEAAGLAARYEASTTVMREALTRLSADQLVESRPNQGFFVRRISVDELEDLTRLRIHVDTLGLRLAIERGDLAWEQTVLAAEHALRRTPRRTEADPLHTTEAWSSAHRAFHIALVEASAVPLIVHNTKVLFDATELYRRWAAPSAGASGRSIGDEHADITAATLDRDADGATAILTRHYQRTCDVIVASGLGEQVVGDAADQPLRVRDVEDAARRRQPVAARGQ